MSPVHSVKFENENPEFLANDRRSRDNADQQNLDF